MSQTPDTVLDGNDADSGRPIVDRLATMTNDTIDRVTATANRAGNELGAAATRTAETAKHVQEQAVAAANANLRRVRSYVERNPLTAVGIAIAVGALLATALVRR